ncbi:MAG: nickel-responsive transcriptional regulator NikR [Planctomycetota bacterium]
MSRSGDGELQRFGVSLETDLLAPFDRSIGELGYPSRSAAIRDLIRAHLIERDATTGEAQMLGTLTLVYDHHKRALSERLIDLQHDHHERVISTLHVHLDEHFCLEVLVLKGPGVRLRETADRLLSLEGVEHGQLTLTGVAKGGSRCTSRRAR